MRLLLALAVTLLTLTPAAAEPLRLFAAASLRTALDQITADWPEGTTISYAGSGALARQIAGGAPADLVLLANADWMGWLVDQGTIPATAPVTFAGGRLVLVGPQNAQPLDLTPAAISTRLDEDGRLAIGDIRAVPAGQYGAEALHSLGLWDAVAKRLVQTDNVRAALAFAARGEVPLALVYASDAVAERRVRVVAEIPATAHAPIRYTAAALTPAGTTALTRLTAAPTQTLLQSQGFTPPPMGGE